MFVQSYSLLRLSFCDPERSLANEVPKECVTDLRFSPYEALTSNDVPRYAGMHDIA
jgi:hypothetical protein